MSNALTSILKGAVAVLPTLATLAGLLAGSGRMRNQLKADVDMLQQLPDESEAHRLLLGHVERQLTTLIEWRTNATRDWSGIAAGGVIFAAFGAVTWWLFILNHWWTFVLGAVGAVFAVAGLVALGQGSCSRASRREGQPHPALM